ncbi:MAG TPA: hypothetical protein VNO30_46940 [Kofleriaceae bacterium]|nr:hypothetical protein [Kofleriaceae bacterium]
MSQLGNPARDEDALRAFLARVLGYERTQAVEHALRSIDLAATHRAALVLLGDADADLGSVARALHCRAVGADRPFVICGRKRGTATAAAQTAHGGSLLVRRRRLPGDFRAAVELVRDPTAAVQLIVCSDARHDAHPFVALPVPIVVPSIRERAHEVPRIIDEYAGDAVRTLRDAWFSDLDREWVIRHAAGSLSEIETATLRRTALRVAGSIEAAAKLLGLTGVGMRQWLHRRKHARRGGMRP